MSNVTLAVVEHPEMAARALVAAGRLAEITGATTGDRVFGEVLLAKPHALASDLRVVGAFARQPMPNLFLGGVTRHMLACADLPVLMRH